MHLGSPGLGGQRGPQPSVGKARLVAQVRGQQAVVSLGQELGQARREPGVIRDRRDEAGTSRSGSVHAPHRDDRARQPARDLVNHAAWPRSRAVDLVDEQQGGHPEAL